MIQTESTTTVGELLLEYSEYV